MSQPHETPHDLGYAILGLARLSAGLPDRAIVGAAALWLVRTWWRWARKPRFMRPERQRPTARERAIVMHRAGNRCEHRYWLPSFLVAACPAALIVATRDLPTGALAALAAAVLAVTVGLAAGPFRCWRRRGLQIDHCRARARGGDHDLDNFAALCGPHNRAKSDDLTPGQRVRVAVGLVGPVALAVVGLTSCAMAPPGPVFIPPTPTTAAPFAVWVCHDGTTRPAIADTEGATPCPN